LQKRPILQISEKNLGFSLSTPAFRYSRKIQLENLSVAFLHAKNCFNTPAFFKKDEFVRQDMFDQFRTCILSNSNWGDVLVETNHLSPGMKQWLTKTVQKYEHIAGVYVHTPDIMGFSLLYGKSLGVFRLATGYFDVPFSSAIVCDFETGKESVFDEILL